MRINKLRRSRLVERPKTLEHGSGRFRCLSNKPSEYLRRGDRIERWLKIESVEHVMSREGMPGDRYVFFDLGRSYRYIWIDYRWRYWLEEGEFVRLVGTVRQIEATTIRLHYVTVY